MTARTGRTLAALTFVCLVVALLGAVGCNNKSRAGGSDALQLYISPQWSDLGISTLAYLGERNTSGEATALDQSHRLIASEIRNQNKYIVLSDKIAEERAEQTGKSELLEHVRQVWSSDQVVDQFAARELCEALGVDAILVSEVADWTKYAIEPTQEGTSWSRVGIGLYIYSPKGPSGPLVWGANRSLRKDSLPYRPTGGAAALADAATSSSKRERESRRDNTLDNVPVPPPIDEVARAVLGELVAALPDKK